jgi:hypothetical protein
MPTHSQRDSLRLLLRWSLPGRSLIFFLSAMSIWCLLAEMYHLCSMRFFTLAILIPATILLILIAIADHFAGDRRLSRAVLIGALAGLLAAIAYDIFRLPFVFAHQWHLASILPAMNLYKPFPRFGAMILNQPAEQPSYSLIAHLVGWTYHFSNGITFGIMYLAIIGNPSRHSWLWAVLLAAGLELAMLFTPYPGFFAIAVTAAFVVVTLAAHILFGIVLGLTSRRLSPYP